MSEKKQKQPKDIFRDFYLAQHPTSKRRAERLVDLASSRGLFNVKGAFGDEECRAILAELEDHDFGFIA